jgi:putative transposase
MDFVSEHKLYNASKHINTCDNGMATKNENIKASLKITIAKRKTQTCRVYELKIDQSHLNQKTQEHLNRLFLEAKWFYNHMLAQDDVFNLDFDDKIKEVPVMVNGIFELRHLDCLSSQMKQGLIKRTQDNIIGLHELKENGHKVGKLRYKSLIQSIPLKQYGNTYKILDKNYIHVQGIKQNIKVRGLKQIPENPDFANGTLIHKHGDYYLSVTTYHEKKIKPVPSGQIGIDFGLSRQLTLTSGIGIQYSIPITAKLRRLSRKLSKQKKHSNNWYKTIIKLNREYDRINNIKKDIKCKIVNHLKENNGIVCYQDENVKAWQRIWGRKILSTAIGGIISTLKKKVQTPVEVDRMYPSTKTCSKCGNIQEMALNERIYVCKNCGTIMDRDHNSSINILNKGLKQIGTVRTELTPVEIEASTLMSLRYLNSIPYVKASSVYESGSFTALA